jgi:hypothetical protein
MLNAEIDNLLGVRHVHMKLTPNGASGRRFDVEDTLLDFLGRHDSTRQGSQNHRHFLFAATRRASATQPIAV